MTKYEPIHEWVKALKLKGPLAQFADSATDHIGKGLDNSKPEDWIFLIAVIGIAYHLYVYGGIGITFDPSGQAKIPTDPVRWEQILKNPNDPWWSTLSL